jgi:hypothetical protein
MLSASVKVKYSATWRSWLVGEIQENWAGWVTLWTGADTLMVPPRFTAAKAFWGQTIPASWPAAVTETPSNVA